MSTHEQVNILMVDDQPATLLSYEVTLSDLGVNLIKATSGREALGHLLKTDVAVVLLDVNMPELNGFELAELIRQHPRCQQTAILFISAVHLTDPDRLKGYEHGAVDYLSVPIVPELLRAKVRVFAELYRKTRQLARLNAELEQRVQERTAELRQRNEKLEIAEEALAQHARDLARAHADLRQVAYVSAHDLQEPVRQVGVYTQMIAKRYRDSLDAETREAVAFIVEGTKRMQAQFTDLLHYLEMEDPGDGVSTTDCNLLVQNALDALREPIAMSNAVVTHDPLPTLTANPKHLQLVFQELIDNAVKFRHSAPPRVHVWAEREVDSWRFAVRDHGIGIDPQSRGQLFGFFRKLQRRTEYPGTGMGLAICKKIVDRHGGRIWLDSQPGEGTTVYFTIRDMGRMQN